ncbi:MAG: hypothetical protein R3356_05595 [Eudoraea sp.]|nr:hypothetical protein [Eudoraea sp.]
MSIKTQKINAALKQGVGFTGQQTLSFRYKKKHYRVKAYGYGEESHKEIGKALSEANSWHGRLLYYKLEKKEMQGEAKKGYAVLSQK